MVCPPSQLQRDRTRARPDIVNNILRRRGKQRHRSPPHLLFGHRDVSAHKITVKQGTGRVCWVRILNQQNRKATAFPFRRLCRRPTENTRLRRAEVFADCGFCRAQPGLRQLTAKLAGILFAAGERKDLFVIADSAQQAPRTSVQAEQDGILQPLPQQRTECLQTADSAECFNRAIA